jgi:DNA-directed RNA polymerase specialized sigma24 family protein
MTALMAEASDTGFASREDGAEALSSLTEADLVRLKRFAQYRSAGLSQLDWQDLLHEAIDRLLSGRRRWPRSVPFVLFMQQTIRSLAHDHWRRRVEGPTLTVADLDAAQHLAFESAPDLTTPAPDRAIEARDSLREVYDLFSDDPLVLAVLNGFAENLAPAEIMSRTSLTTTAFASARRKIRRTVERAIAEGRLTDARF